MKAGAGETYRHTQVNWRVITVLAVAWMAAFLVAVQIGHPIAIAVVATLGVLLSQFPTLTIIVHREAIEVFFGPGLIRRRIDLGRIQDLRIVRTPWYYGWGIRLTPFGWLWRLWGLDGVEIQFDDGHCFRVGSDEPDRLASALEHATRTFAAR